MSIIWERWSGLICELRWHGRWGRVYRDWVSEVVYSRKDENRAWATWVPYERCGVWSTVYVLNDGVYGGVWGFAQGLPEFRN